MKRRTLVFETGFDAPERDVFLNEILMPGVKIR